VMCGSRQAVQAHASDHIYLASPGSGQHRIQGGPALSSATHANVGELSDAPIPGYCIGSERHELILLILIDLPDSPDPHIPSPTRLSSELVMCGSRQAVQAHASDHIYLASPGSGQHRIQGGPALSSATHANVGELSDAPIPGYCIGSERHELILWSLIGRADS